MNDTIILLLKEILAQAPGLAGSSTKRSYATFSGNVPRCPNRPSEVVAALKRVLGGIILTAVGPPTVSTTYPTLGFTHCCDNHDNCYDDCGQTFDRVQLGLFRLYAADLRRFG